MIEVEPPNASRHGRKWTVRTESGCERVDPDDGAGLRRACKHLGVTPDEVRASIAEAPVPESEELESEPPSTIRAWTGTNTGAAQEFDAMDAALESELGLIMVTGGALSMVDVDLEPGASGWDLDAVDRIVTRTAAPTPAFAWPTRSGGFRAVFDGDGDGLTALQRAGLWCLLVDEVTCADGVKEVERIPTTRKPPDGEWVEGPSRYGVADLRSALLHQGDHLAVHPAAVFTWLAEHGMEMGQRYEHDHCPWNPTHVSSGPPSVEAYNSGVVCYSCHRRVPWSVLVDGEVTPNPAPVVRMALELVHWTHAQWILAAEYQTVDPSFRRAGYEGLLTILHPSPDPRVAKRLRGVWDPDRAYVRAHGIWLRVSDYECHRELSKASLAALPWTRGKPDRIDMALGSAELNGYYPIEPVLHLVDAPEWHDKTVLVPQPVSTVTPDYEITWAEAEDHLRETLPGVTDLWLRQAYILVVAALRAQLRLPQPTFVLLEGGTGSGKGALAAFAAGVMGTKVGQLRFDGTAELGMALGAALQSRCSVILGDEAGKVDRWWAQSSTLLKITATHTWRQLYVGDVTTPVRAVLVLAGSTLPRGLSSMAEFSRRATFLRLDGVRHTEWATGVQQYLGTPQLEELRHVPIGAAIAEAYVREARELVRATSADDWIEVADSLGGGRLSETDDAREVQTLVDALYAIWVHGGEGCRVERGPKSGWLRCWRAGHDDEAAELMEDYLDEDASLRERRARIEALCTASPAPGVVMAGGVRNRRVFVRFR